MIGGKGKLWRVPIEQHQRDPVSNHTSAWSVPEWGHLPIGNGGVSPVHANQLHALAERESRRLRVPHPILARTAGPSLRAGQVVGVLSVPGARVEILPKIGDAQNKSVRHALTRMLTIAWNLPVADNEPALLSTQREDLLEVIIRLFAERLLVSVRRGLPHRYLSREEDLTRLRGKLNVKRQFTHHAVRPDRLACRYDELSVDTPLNRVFKATVARLATITDSAVSARLLAELSARFEFVGQSTDPLGERVTLDRTNSAFHRLYSMARMFLSGTWQTTTSGSGSGLAVLFPMNDLFEVFVGRSMMAALGPRDVRLQRQDRYALRARDQSLFTLKPDIVVRETLVLDTKWKHLQPGDVKLGVDQSDVYQMLAYAHGYEAKRLVLIYPAHAELGNAGILRRWRVAGTGTAFDIAAVDVARPTTVADTLQTIVDDTQYTDSEVTLEMRQRFVS